MWRCSNCGEQIDEVFDACWQCGTSQDGIPAVGFQEDSSDFTEIDSSRDSDRFRDAAEVSVVLQEDGAHGRLIELCSTTDAIEAHILRNLLAEAGIRSCIVGEFLANAAGVLPLGETLAPRIWVREEDAADARLLIDTWMDQSHSKTIAHSECNESIKPDSDTGEESVSLTSSIRFCWFAPGLIVLGGFCVLCGVVWAAFNWMLMHRYPEMTCGVLVDCDPRLNVYQPPPPEIPLPRMPATINIIYKARYAFDVHGLTYYTKVADYGQIQHHEIIHYDPNHPDTNFAGSLTPPMSILAWTLGIGGMFMFPGFYMRQNKKLKQIS